MMTDNRTTELREKLTKRGVEYDESTQGNTTFFRFDYCDSCGDYMHTIAITGECISAYSDYLTPEQAIAATLGSEREKELEELVRDAYWLIARAVWTHVSQDKFAADWTERVSVTGIEVD